MVRLLSELCRREGVSQAEAVRRAVADYLEVRHHQDRDNAFGIWRDRNAEGLAYERRIRLPNAIIWASARRLGGILVTRNTKDFPVDDPGVRVPYSIPGGAAPD